LTIVLVLNLLLISALVVVGLAAGSLGVLAAGVDYLADASAIGISLLAIRLARRPPTARRPQGYRYVTNLAALINVVWLLVLNIAVMIAAAHRLAAGSREVHGLPVLIVSSVAAVVMVAGALILGGDGDDGHDDRSDGEDLNLKAVLLDTLADAAAAAGVAITGAIILAKHGWYWLDPVVALLIAAVIGFHAIALARRVLTALRSPAETPNHQISP
jgi:cobalt-zinc-cadmium efflux system protein